MVFPVMVPADIEELVVAYLGDVLWPTPVRTRLPSPETVDREDGFLRVESAGGTKANIAQYDLSVIVHGYSPDEVTASSIARRAVAYLSAASGLTIDGWYIVSTSDPVTPARLTDPNVNLPRYRAMATWRVAGQPPASGS